MNVCIRAAEADDFESMWAVLQSIIASGERFPLFVEMDKASFRSQWFGSHAAYVAIRDGEVRGMYRLGTNCPGLGSHFGSATCLVSAGAEGQGIGSALIAHSLSHACFDGHLALQFHYVVSTHAAAAKLANAN